MEKSVSEVVKSDRKKSRKVLNNEREAGDGGVYCNAMHIWTERERRKKMKNMFSILHHLLHHQLPSKQIDKSTIVDEAVKYIKTLEHTVEKLEKDRNYRSAGMVIDGNEVPSTTTFHPEPQQVLVETRESFLADHRQQSNNSMNSAPISLPVDVFPAPSKIQTWFSPNVIVNIFGDDAHISVCSPRKPGLSTTIFYILEKHHLDVVSAHISSDHCRSMYMIHAHARGANCDRFEDALSVEDIFKLAAGEMNLWLFSY
ncbi:hypothetical protein UlMin_035038 [Ulmus minor]